MRSQPLPSPNPTEEHGHREVEQFIQITQLPVEATGRSSETVSNFFCPYVSVSSWQMPLPAFNGVFCQWDFKKFFWADRVWYNSNLIIFYYRHWVTVAYPTWGSCKLFFNNSRYWILMNDFLVPVKNEPLWIYETERDHPNIQTLRFSSKLSSKEWVTLGKIASSSSSGLYVLFCKI